MTFFFCLQCYNLNESFIRRREYLFQTIYIDILFAINFSMDFLAIYITSYLLKLKFKTFKAVIAAILGALYSAFTVILRTDSIILALFFAYFMCYIAFEKRNLKNSIYNFIAYIAVNFLIGGGMTAVFSVFNKLVGERIVTIYGDVNSVPEKLPFSIFVLTSFYKGIPYDLEEAAVIDGASPLRTFAQIVMPLTLPAMVAVTINNLLNVWNEFLYALIFLTDKNIYTLPIGLFYLSQAAEYSSSWTILFAGMMISIVPVLIIFAVFQRQFASGVSQGAVKG